MEERSRDDMYKARSYFERAIVLDSGFALAYSGLSDVNLLLCNRGHVEPTSVLLETKKYIDRALELDPLSAETQASSGYWYYQNFNFVEAEQRFRKSIDMNPNQDNVYNWLGQLLEQTGREQEALDIYRKGIRVNPSFLLLKGNMLNLLASINSEEAIRITSALIDSTFGDPDQKLFFLVSLSKYYWYAGKREQAASVAEQAGITALSIFYKTGNNAEMVEEVNQKYQDIQNRGEYISHFRAGMDYAIIGARAKAMEHFQKAIELRDPGVPALLSKSLHSVVLLLHDDPELKKMESKVKELIQYNWPNE
jgi:tetratricopeptide (TPR) repeat protein